MLAAVPAASHAWDLKPMLKVGYDIGGDTLFTALFTDGSRRSIKANEGGFLGAGVSIVNAAKDLETEISLSYKTQNIRARNGDIDWTRYPLDALVFYRFSKVRLGGASPITSARRWRAAGWWAA